MYDYLLNLFISQEENRPRLKMAHKVGSDVYATDAQTLIKIPKRLLKKTNKFHPEPFDFVNLMRLEEINEFEVSVSELMEELATAHIRHNMLPCEKCKGLGDVECPCCENFNECDECDGSGESDNIVPVRVTYTEITGKRAIKLGYKTFQPHYIERLLIVALALGLKKVRLLNCENDSKLGIFMLADVTVGIMPYMIKTKEENPY